MIKPNQLVTPEDTRGTEKCFYCTSVVGKEHDRTCVCRTRTVVIKVEVEMVREVPESWGPGDIEFHLNGSSWCASNIVKDLGDGPKCLCNHFTGHFIREASKEDEQGWGFTGR